MFSYKMICKILENLTKFVKYSNAHNIKIITNFCIFFFFGFPDCFKKVLGVLYIEDPKVITIFLFSTKNVH